ncbi:hypothetical protein DNC80_10345 [Flavobacterium sp. SOK18b]|uniref:hypothetical protein n=1 Tax=Flavobacterium sp. SOK18b TaxID=797900 RepID=UPI0015FCFFC6|nr:hypothetical protein [Flavobacterium sp. SOK18b]MBB1194061.1 hypothetical protein [Flavobacterium sp. SOK18b]
MNYIFESTNGSRAQLISNNKSVYLFEPTSEEITRNISHYDDFIFNFRAAINPADTNGEYGACRSNISIPLTASELIKGVFPSASGCFSSIFVTEFKPNVTIQKSNTLTTLCSGETLDLAGFPAGFPNEAYHWQYSLDNQQTWIDVPTNFNNNPTTNFSVKDVLGDSHVNYFDKQLYFRLGYQSRPFTDPITITYSACAPVITNLNPIQPNCSGDPMTVIVTFDRPLDPIKNEKLTYFQIIQKTGELTGNQIPEIIAFDTANTLQYTYNNVTGLINGEIYTVKYQAFQGVKERGVPETDKDFQYQDPTAVQFEIISAENPLCHDGTGEIVISVKGGTGAYKFYVDNIQKFPIQEPNGTYKLKDLAPKENKIKVTDSNDCIDNGKNE